MRPKEAPEFQNRSSLIDDDEHEMIMNKSFSQSSVSDWSFNPSSIQGECWIEMQSSIASSMGDIKNEEAEVEEELQCTICLEILY